MYFKKLPFIFISLILQFSIFNFNSVAQVARNYYFKNYSLRDGLPQSQVYVIFQDSRGNLWFGTNSGGICSYDGRSFITYTSDEGLSDNTVNAIAEDREGNLWLGTYRGVSVFDGSNFITLRNLDGLNGKEINAIFKDSNDNLWFGANGGLYLLPPPVLRNALVNRLITHDKLEQATVNTIFEDSHHYVWLGTDKGIFRLSQVHGADSGLKIVDPEFSGEIPTIIGENFTVEDGLAHNSTVAILEDKSGNLWFGTQMGLCKIDSKYMNPDKIIAGSAQHKSGFQMEITIEKYLYGKEIKSLLEDIKGDIWIGTLGAGVWKYDGWDFSILTIKQGIFSDGIWSIINDRENNVWLGTDGGGVIKCIEAKFTSITQRDGLSSNMVLSILEDRKGNLWFGAHNGVNKVVENGHSGKLFNKKTFYYYNQSNGFSSKEIWSVIEDKRGNIWFASYGDGIFKLPPKSNKFLNYNKSDGLVNNELRVLYEDKAGNIWVGTRGGISKIMVTKDKAVVKIVNYTTKDGLCHNAILAIIQDRKGNLWVATSGGGVCKYDGLTFTNYTQSEGLANNTVLSLAEDNKGNIWSATYGGISRLIPGDGNKNKGEFSNITKGEGLSSNTVYIIKLDDEGNLLIGTSKGLDKLNLYEFNKTGKIILKHYGYDEGFSGIECNTNASFKDKEGDIWFGTIKGAIKYKPVHDIPNQKRPQTHIVGLQLFFEVVDWKAKFQNTNIKYDSVSKWYTLPQNLVLPYDKNHLTFEFIAISLKIPEKVRYQWKLEGFDQKWSPVTSKYEATYSNLPHGEYTFKVKACNNDGLWNKNPAEFSFLINPPFWKTWWFYTICCFALIGSGYAFLKIRLKNLEKAEKLLTQQVRLKTKQLADERDKVKKQHEEIARKNKRIISNIRYAQNIQESILPEREKITEVIPESFILFKPKDIVSGDFYWYAEKNNRVVVAAVDCMGHGVPGAFMSIIGNELLNDIVIRKNILKPSMILEKLHEGVVSSLTKNIHDTELIDGMDISLCTIDPVKKFLEFSGARQSLVLIRNRKVELIKGDNLPIGFLYKSQRNFKSHIIDIKNKDAVYILTDGYYDQFGGKDNDKFMSARFYDLLLDMQKSSMARQQEILNSTIEQWKGDNEQLDDILVIGMRF
ncbi:MAG: SpoIIE family protein phosphatase [Cytophagales bacterium]|nr:SpoIIE family protein phosphatase [Cytophagales bacterium]